MTTQEARAQIAALYASYGSWRPVGEKLADDTGNPLSLAVLANRAYHGGTVAPSLLDALGLKKKRFRRAIEFDTAEEAALFDEWLENGGYASVTHWFRTAVWEVY